MRCRCWVEAAGCRTRSGCRVGFLRAVASALPSLEAAFARVVPLPYRPSAAGTGGTARPGRSFEGARDPCAPARAVDPPSAGRSAAVRASDRLVLAALSRVAPRRSWSEFPVRPETLLRWHRRLIARRWTLAFDPGPTRSAVRIRRVVFQVAALRSSFARSRFRSRSSAATPKTHAATSKSPMRRVGA